MLISTISGNMIDLENVFWLTMYFLQFWLKSNSNCKVYNDLSAIVCILKYPNLFLFLATITIENHAIFLSLIISYIQWAKLRTISIIYAYTCIFSVISLCPQYSFWQILNLRFRYGFSIDSLKISFSVKIMISNPRHEVSMSEKG